MNELVRRVTVDGWDLDVSGDEPTVLDVDLAERVGLARPRKIRDIIGRHRAELEIHGPLSMRPTVVRIEKSWAIRGSEHREVVEYHLTEPQALALLPSADPRQRRMFE